MAARPIIIDCDPGQDDAVALFLAMASPDDFDILGITTVAGNVPLALTERNARMMCDIAGREDIPVFAGCDTPMIRTAITAEYVHGATGIDGIDAFEPNTPLQDQHAVAWHDPGKVNRLFGFSDSEIAEATYAARESEIGRTKRTVVRISRQSVIFTRVKIRPIAIAPQFAAEHEASRT